MGSSTIRPSASADARTAMDFTKSFVRSKNPCAEGFRWYLRHHRNGSDYQQVLDHLVRDGRIEDACWLLDKVGPANTVLKLDQFESDAIVYAGSIEVRGSVDVGSVLRVGGSLRCGGTVRAGKLVVGEDLRCGGGLHCEGDLQCGESLLAQWHVTVGGDLRAGELRVAGNVSCRSRMSVEGPALVKGDLLVGGDCTAKALSVRGCLEASRSVRIWHGLICDAGIRCGMHLDAGWGIKSGADITSAGAIRAGEGLESGGQIRAGDGYGIFAGLCVQREDWETSARVSARHRPIGLLSGCWTGAAREPDHAD